MDKFINEYTRIYRGFHKSLQRTVRVDHEEVCILVVSDLIQKRNACKDERQKAFDVVLRWYIDDDEFERFVIKGVEWSAECGVWSDKNDKSTEFMLQYYSRESNALPYTVQK